MFDPPAARRTGVLILRVWIEDTTLRGTVTSRLDTSRDETDTAAGQGPAALVHLVEGWLDHFSAAARDRPGNAG